MDNPETVNAYFAAFIGITMLTLLAVGFVLFTLRYQKRMAYQEKELIQRQLSHQEELIKNSIDSSEKERARIARDLHDELGAILATLNLQLNKIDTSESNPIIVKNSKELVDNGIQRVRQISHSLMPPELDLFGLTATLEMYVNQLIHSSTGILDVSLSIDSTLLTKEQELAFYRITMELLSNSIKYSEASHIQIELINQRDFLTYLYQDNGKGFEWNAHKSQTGMGLKNIESRAIALGGNLDFITAPNRGFTCTIHLNITA